MSHKIIEAAKCFGVSLSESDGKLINAFLGITDKRRNLNEPEKLLLERICGMVQQSESVESAIALLGSTDAEESTSLVESPVESRSTDEVDLNSIIESQANYAADAALMSLPNLASAEMESFRRAFIVQFRKRIRERLQSAEYMSAFITQIDSQVQLPATDTTLHTVLTASLDDEG